MEITNQVEQEERRILMALSQVYLEWEKQTKRLGLEQGVQQGREKGMQ
jgi:flagellar biosynthesis/type III secretory pathway protein FliH